MLAANSSPGHRQVVPGVLATSGQIAFTTIRHDRVIFRYEYKINLKYDKSVRTLLFALIA